MFLLDMKNEIPQKWYSFLPTLERVKAIDIENIDGRLKLLFELLSYTDSLKMRIKKWTKIYNPRTVAEKLGKATTYRKDPAMVWFNFWIIITELSFEIEKENNWEFDFSMIKSILKGDKDYSDFIITPEKVSLNNKIWSFVWKSGEEYSWQGLWWAMKLNTVKLIDLFEWLWETEVINFIDWNKDLIKKEFKNKRNAYLSVIKNKIDEKSESKLLSLMK
jgi:hypothetical protein